MVQIKTKKMNKKNPYKTLNVPTNATQDEIKKAYKNKAKKSHPDVGGDENEFKEISSAYALLADPKKREYYDQYGDEPQSQDSTLNKATRLINTLIDQMLQKHTPEEVLKQDFIKEMKNAITDNKNKLKQEVANQNTMMERLSKMIEIFEEKLSHEGKNIKINIFITNVEEKKNYVMRNLKDLDDQEKVLDKSLEILSDYNFDYDKQFEEQLEQQIARQRSAYDNSTSTSSFFGF